MINVFLILSYSAPIAIAALGEIVNEKAGSINIGLEGMMLVSAFFSAWASLASGNVWIGLGTGIGSALVLMLVQSFFTLNLAMDSVVVGTATNLLALGITGTLFRTHFVTTSLTKFESLRKWGPVDPVVVAMIVLVPLVLWILAKSRWGLALRAAGEYPEAVEATGFKVLRLRWGAALVAGLLAGVAGSYLTLGFSGSFSENMTAGRGFVAIAMVTFGRWKAHWVFAGAMLVGFLEGLQFTLQSQQTKIPYPLLNALPYVAALLVLIIAGKGRGAPASLGLPWRKA